MVETGGVGRLVGHDLVKHRTNIQGKEDERLVGFLAAAAYTGRGVEEARVPVVVLSRENEGG